MMPRISQRYCSASVVGSTRERIAGRRPGALSWTLWPWIERRSSFPSRTMILPRTLIGKSSFQYVDESDRDKPRVQQYKILADFPIARPAGI